MSHPRVVSPVLAGLFLLATLSPVLNGIPAVQAAPTDVLHVDGNSFGFGQPGRADWDAYVVPNYQGTTGPMLWGTSLNANSAEPSGGVCWATSDANPLGKDVFFFKTMTGVGRAVFNDAASPATVAWNDVSRRTVPEGHYVFADPILHTDEETCRTWAGHMEFPSPCTTDIAFRDESPTALPPGNPVDGWTTTPACQASANDHQTIGSGPYSRDVPVPADAAYPRIVYYCAQYPTINSCVESYDGGATWLAIEPGTAPGQPLTCAGLFGHVKVSEAEGYAAIPHASCINWAGLQLSKNNGLTWSAIDIPGIPDAARFDPGLAWSRTAKPGGNSMLYFAAGMSGGLYASVSPNFGASWQNTGRISDAYTGPNGEKITRAEFANVEAGDWDRAAVSFLGTTDTTPSGNAWTCTSDNRIVWYMYVARTFNAGQTWQVERASGDPVQVGGIWPGGGSEVCRNLLDFNDLDMGSDGRLYVSFADGCTAAAGCFDGASVGTSRGSRGTVIRQSSGCGLLSAADAVGSDCASGTGTETGPKVTITSPADGATVAGTITVEGTVNRDAVLGGAGAGGAASPLPLPGLKAASLIHPAAGQNLYLHTRQAPVGNVDRANGGSDLVPEAPTGAAPSVSGHVVATSTAETVAVASWTYHGPVELSDAEVTVTWYGRQASTATDAPQTWEASLYIGAASIGNINAPHPTVTGQFDSTLTAKTLTFPHVSGSGQNMVLMLRSTTNTVPAFVLYGSASYPSGIRVVENGDTTVNVPPTAAFDCTATYLTVACDGSASTDDDTIVSYAWTFGDGGTGTGATVNHTYATAGAKTVTLKVTDNDGAFHSTSRAYTVTTPPPPAEVVQLLVDGVMKGSVEVDSAAPGDHAWSTDLLFTDVAGDHTLTARWLASDGTELDTDTITLTVSGGASPEVAIESPSDGATVTAGPLPVSGSVDRHGAPSPAAAPLQLPGLRAASLVHPSGQDLYLATSTVPVGNVDRVSGNGPALVETPPSSATPSVSVHAAATPPAEAAPSASWTYRGPVDLVDADITVTWYGRLLTNVAPQQWDVHVFIGATQIATSTLPHAFARGTFPDTVDVPKTLTIPDVTGSGQNMVISIRGTVNTHPAIVLYGSAGFPSSVHVAEAGAQNEDPVAAFSCTASDLALSCDGSASTDDSAVASYAWDFGDGSTGSGATASRTYAAAGTYTVTLTVTDDDGATDSATNSYTVSSTPVNDPPTAAFSCTPTGLSLSCDGSASSDDEGVASYAWNFGDGSTGSGATASHTYSSGGTKTVTLTVTDTDGATGTVSHDYEVTAPNQAPVAAFSCTASDLAVACDGSASTDDDAIASYAWDFGDGSTGSGATAGHTYATAGTYTVTLTVTDGDGAADAESHDYTVSSTPVNDPPMAAFSCTPTGLSLSCDGTASTDDEGIASYGWNFGDGSTGTGATASHTYSSAGTKTVTLTVTDTDGATGTVSHDYEVATPPSERVEVLLDGVQVASQDVDSSAPGPHGWATGVDLTGLSGSHTLTARWVEADGTEIDTHTVTVQVSTTTTTGTGTSTTTSTTSTTSETTSTTGSSTTGTNTGNAGGSVNNVAPVVDYLSASPAVLTLDHAVHTVDFDGGGHDDNGHEDVASVTVKVTNPSGTPSFPAVTRSNDTNPLDVMFNARQDVDDGSEPGTYQVDSFLTDAGGLQSEVVSVTFTVLEPTTSSVSVGYTGGADRLDFGSFNPGAANLTSVNAFSVANELGRPARFLFDMTDFACSRGAVPVMGNADVVLGTVDGSGVFTPQITKPYTESTVDFGTLNDQTRVFVKLTLHQVPKGIAGLCTASFGLYHT